MSYGRITDKQREILEYIKKEILNRGYPPTVRDICEAVNLKSTSSALLILIAAFKLQFKAIGNFSIGKVELVLKLATCPKSMYSSISTP